jgi:transaldolase
METNYISSVMRQTPTRVWVNNPVEAEVERGIEMRVVGATTNPTYVMKLHKKDEVRPVVESEIRALLATEADDQRLIARLEMRMVGRIAKMLLPVYEETHGERGLVAIQGNPFHDNDADYMVQEALQFFTVSPNIIVKIPGTCAGVDAFRTLTAMNKKLIVTGCVSVSQISAFQRAYMEVHERDGLSPRLFVTTLAGPMDEFSKAYIAENHITLSDEALSVLGNQFSKMCYRYCREQGFPGRLMGGGARSYSNFSEIVGGDMDSTLNYVFIEQLNALNLPVESRIDCFCSREIYNELTTALPYYGPSCEPGGLKNEAFDRHPPFVAFRDAFVKAWNYLAGVVANQRAGR